MAALLPIVVAPAAAEPQAAPRYPYDPLCPWGRLADGHGMLVRCLAADEVTALVAGVSAAGQSAPGQSAAGSAAGEHAAQQPSAPAVSEPPPTAAAPAPPAPPPPSPPPAPSTPPQRAQVAEVGPLSVDTGDLPRALAELRKPRDRYADCVNQNGGLRAARGSVHVRFLVRELGRAEGVLVKEHHGVTLQAAKCVAGVVDRRHVGYPEAPIVGATIVIELEPSRAR